ncbi:MAG: hypothetical protein U5L74_11940 [Ideonella sp.]|nr:hypothetical protein [Ideonella sp.]
MIDGLPSRRENAASGAEIVDLMPVALLVHVGDKADSRQPGILRP